MNNDIINGRTALGIEFGSTRVKAILIGDDYTILASGSHEWENKYNDNIWTYSLDSIWEALRDSYKKMAQDVQTKYGVELTRIGSIGFSGMMHGYMTFSNQDEQLVPFRTWRNTMTEEAASVLTDAFQYNIPQRWSIAHLYQAILKREAHVKDISFVTTLAGYIHWKLTGEKVLGVGDASGMFPIDINTKGYDLHKIELFNELIKIYNFGWKVEEVLPQVVVAGEYAGVLTEEGARLLDPTGKLQSGIPLCPPEGDAGTGMVATNSIARCTGNVSAGTSVFAMFVLERELEQLHTEIDLVTTPGGDLVAMVHCNNCTSDLNAWANLFKEFAECLGVGEIDMTQLFSVLYQKALEGEADCGGLLAYNYFSGEHITGFQEGCPVFVRRSDAQFNLANFMRTHLFTSLGALKVGVDILLKEKVAIEKIVGHGGLFKTKEVGQKVMAAAMNAPISVMETAGEGGAWGIAILARYMKNKQENEQLETYLEERVFKNQDVITIYPDPIDVKGFEGFMEKYNAGLVIEKVAVGVMNKK